MRQQRLADEATFRVPYFVNLVANSTDGAPDQPTSSAATGSSPSSSATGNPPDAGSSRCEPLSWSVAPRPCSSTGICSSVSPQADGGGSSPSPPSSSGATRRG